mmetsp:Transcript_5115/g.18364  ORF Transcript_5115/g.18364 Transcript_5115/m.18364 type:complete len:236 (-) Transcript_5115:130-837(-)
MAMTTSAFPLCSASFRASSMPSNLLSTAKTDAPDDSAACSSSWLEHKTTGSRPSFFDSSTIPFNLSWRLATDSRTPAAPAADSFVMSSSLVKEPHASTGHGPGKFPLKDCWATTAFLRSERVQPYISSSTQTLMAFTLALVRACEKSMIEGIENFLADPGLFLLIAAMMEMLPAGFLIALRNLTRSLEASPSSPAATSTFETWSPVHRFAPMARFMGHLVRKETAKCRRSCDLPC